MAIEVFMPKMSDNMDEGEVVEWLVQEGDSIEKGQPILVILTDKASVEIEAPATGVLKGLRPGVDAGSIVPVGETIAFIADLEEEVPVLQPIDITEAEVLTTTTSITEQTKEPQKADFLPTPSPHQGASTTIRATPVARRIARELGIDISQVKGTGRDSKIKEEDVKAYAQSRASVESDQLVREDSEWMELTAIQRVTGQRLVESVQTAPHFALSIEVDMTSALNFRESYMDQVVSQTGERLSITAILVQVVASVLKLTPRINSSFSDGRIQIHKHFNIGVAVGSEAGLFVPVIKDADQKSLVQITNELTSFHKKAEEIRFSKEDLTGSTFTITNLGMYGIDRFHAIINPPESAILAVGRVVKKPLGMLDDTIALRPIMNLTLSIDHRSLDGRHAANFLSKLLEQLENPNLKLE
jgi:pyruvate dehydrogenase E2 component (dihydrolipoamide acetyltransferase)